MVEILELRGCLLLRSGSRVVSKLLRSKVIKDVLEYGHPYSILVNELGFGRLLPLLQEFNLKWTALKPSLLEFIGR